MLSFVDVRRRFDFRSIEIGRWVTEQERDRAAGKFYGALEDLMAVLNCPEAVISLRGSLAFQYGIGGRPGVAAHYIPAKRCFSLAKNAGPGSIAHEWFHGFDHYLAERAFEDAPSGMFASSAWLSDATIQPHGLNDLLHQCFKAVLLDATGNEPSPLCSASLRMDRKLKTQYFSLPEELCARAFECFVTDRLSQLGRRNNFLVDLSKRRDEADAGLLPSGAQRQQINYCFERYFSALGAALTR